jgi:hypothetical protein
MNPDEAELDFEADVEPEPEAEKRKTPAKAEGSPLQEPRRNLGFHINPENGRGASELRR